MCKAWIKPVYVDDKDGWRGLVSYALCRSNTPLVDGDVIEHFEPDYTGKEIKETAKEFYGIDECVWGSPINHAS
jgi:hypothetical protein